MEFFSILGGHIFKFLGIVVHNRSYPRLEKILKSAKKVNSQKFKQQERVPKVIGLRTQKRCVKSRFRSSNSAKCLLLYDFLA